MNARYMVTSVCHRGCSYCISKNVNIKQDNDIVRIANVFNYVSKTYDSLEITGGEPTLDPKLTLKIILAKQYFPVISVRTAEPLHLDKMQCQLFDHINVSAHDLGYYLNKYPEDILQLRTNQKMHLSINVNQYSAELIQRLWNHGWDGLSIWEDVWNPKPKSDLQVDVPEGFSVRHLSSDECLDQLIILPDLDIITGREYEKRFLGETNEQYTNYPMSMPRLVASI